MNKRELKKILKPLIKECIKEVLFEDGTLSTIISEVTKSTANRPVVQEHKRPERQFETAQQAKQRRKSLLQENREKMQAAIGKNAYNGVDLFEGTTPMKNASVGNPNQPPGIMEGVDPQDPGVDISAFGTNRLWKKLAGN
mgnify:CR=1 FL=1